MIFLQSVERFTQLPATARLTLLALSFCLIAPRLEACSHEWEASALATSETVRSTVQELGLGAKVKVSTVSRVKPYQGYITSIGENSFEVTDVAHWQANAFNYSVIHRIAGQRLSDSSGPVENRVLRAVFSVASRFGVGP
jgi:hypothetical protein